MVWPQLRLICGKPLITDGTLFLCFRAYKTESRGRFFRCGIQNQRLPTNGSNLRSDQRLSTHNFHWNFFGSWHPLITDGTLLLRFRAYKAESGGIFFRRGIQNQRLSKASHKWVELEVGPKVKYPQLSLEFLFQYVGSWHPLLEKDGLFSSELEMKLIFKVAH